MPNQRIAGSISVRTPRSRMCPTGTLRGMIWCSLRGMKTTELPAPRAGNQLWGIYHTDREYARVQGDPLCTVVETPAKIAAEELAARLYFGDPWAHPVTQEEVRQALWLPRRQHSQRQRPTHKSSLGIRI